jgi:protein-S-isoprenylcysteine O-methyltransferase Ste14
MAEFLRYALPVYLVVYFGAAFVWPTVRVWSLTGANPYKLGATDSAHDFIGRLFRLLLAATAGIVAVYAILGQGHEILLPIVALELPALAGLGLGLLAASLAWTLVAQAQMGRAWRIGIDPAERTSLVTSGVFRLSRNPIFLGMRLTLLGLFLAVPNTLTLLVLALGEALIHIQVRLEEEHLARTHGQAYRDYCRQTRRWL